MAKKCDYYVDDHGKDWCILKKGEISRDTYKEYCYYDERKKCPLYQYYTEEMKKR